MHIELLAGQPVSTPRPHCCPSPCLLASYHRRVSSAIALSSSVLEPDSLALSNAHAHDTVLVPPCDVRRPRQDLLDLITPLCATSTTHYLRRRGFVCGVPAGSLRICGRRRPNWTRSTLGAAHVGSQTTLTVSAVVHYADGSTETRDLKLRLQPRTICDPIVYYSRIQHICRVRQQGHITNVDFRMDSRRSTDSALYQVVNSESFCTPEHGYALLHNNDWLR